MNDDLIFDDDDEFFDDSSLQQQDLPPVEEPDLQVLEDDLTLEVLKLKGITDPEKIKFEDESGAVIERAWNSLSRNEQLNILVDNDNSSIEDELDLDEIELLNTIRNSNMSVAEYLLSLYVPQEQPKQYDIDSFSDDELYAYDLINKVGEDITDDEITQAIETAKQNEKLYLRTVEGLRKEYIRLQEEREALANSMLLAQRQEQYNAFVNTINNEISNFNTFAGLELELSNEDMNELASFMLDIDESGMSAFGKAMNDPYFFTKAAFWILNEDEIVRELNKLIQDNYRRGYEAGKADNGQKATSKLVIAPSNPLKPSNDDIIEDDEWD